MTREVEAPEAGAWIVGIDDSDGASHALRWVVAQQADAETAPRATQLRLVTAWQAPIYGPYPGIDAMTTSPYDTEAVRANAAAQLDTVVTDARPLVAVPVEAVVTHGGASAALLDASENAAMLVVGNRGQGGFKRLMLGSTSTQCATHAVVPTVIVPAASPIRRAMRITVGIDGSPNSSAALDWALEFAAAGAHITVLYVWDASPLAVGADQFFFPEASDLAHERFDHQMDAIEIDEGKQLVVNRQFVSGSPRTVLREAATTADLLVVGARGHGGVGAALLGSVSTWLLHHVDVPTAIVPEASSDLSRGRNPEEKP